MSSIAGSRAAAGGESAGARVKAYFFSDSRRSIQTVLGLIWLLVGALQFQSFMYGNGFIQLLQGLTGGQPGWVASSVNQGAATMESHQAIFNTGAALIQLAIGFGILYKRTTKPAILVSFAWVLAVWWFGEAFGMMFMATTPMGGIPMASALTGAPGAVLLYALIGAIVWPNDRPGGLLGVRGARIAWAALWLLMAWLWLVEAGGANGIHNAINAAPSGMSWLSSVQDGFASITKGNGLIFALVAIGGLGGDRGRGRGELAREGVPRAGSRVEPGLLGRRAGVRRDLRAARPTPTPGCCSSCSPTRCTR